MNRPATSSADMSQGATTVTTGLSESDSSIAEQVASEFSSNIIHSNSYPLTPLYDGDNQEVETDIADEENKKIVEQGNKAGVLWQVGAVENSVPSGPSRYSPGKIGLEKQPREWFEQLTDYLVKCLQNTGICVIDRVLGIEKGDAVLNDVFALHQQDRFTDGQLVKGNPQMGNFRGDKIMWTDGMDPNCRNIRWLISQMDTVIQMTQGHFENINIVSRTKAMVACYPSGGSHYVKHVDNPNQDGRCITCIYYLNKGWNSKNDGGLLRISPQGQDSIANIEPIFDRMIFFWSDRRNPHEVLPTCRMRYAITVWYFNTSERERAKARTKLSP